VIHFAEICCIHLDLSKIWANDIAILIVTKEKIKASQTKSFLSRHVEPWLVRAMILPVEQAKYHLPNITQTTPGFFSSTQIVSRLDSPTKPPPAICGCLASRGSHLGVARSQDASDHQDDITFLGSPNVNLNLHLQRLHPGRDTFVLTYFG